MFHVGDHPTEVDIDNIDLDLETTARPSTLGTGGGTDHDDASIRQRPEYRWEGVLNDPIIAGKRRKRRWFAKLGAWFGITPLWQSSMPSKGISIDVHIEDGCYVLNYDQDHVHSMDTYKS